MAYQEVACPQCRHTSVNKRGFSSVGTQRDWCKICQQTFQLQYRYNACKPGMKDQILEQAMNGGGIRDIWRTLKVSTGTVLSTLKGVQDRLFQVNKAVLGARPKGDTGREVEMFCESELDEQWSYVQNKDDQALALACD